MNKQLLFTQGSKSGLIRSFVVVIFGILFLSFLGFDLRGQVEEFQTDNQESITTVKQILYETIIPKTKDSLIDIQALANEHNITIENARELIKVLQEYGENIDLEQYGITLPVAEQNTEE